jgi:hypothetical protein
MATAAKNIVESFREVVQDLLLPEFKALKATAEAQREDSRQLRSDLKDSVGGLRIEIRESLDALRNEMRIRDDRQTDAIRSLTKQFDFAVEARERLASLEARMPRQ